MDETPDFTIHNSRDRAEAASSSESRLPKSEVASSPVLDVRNLRTHFFTEDGVVKAVDGVNFRIGEHEIMALVGESGSGKTVTGLSILRLVAEPPGKILDGELWFQGEDLLRKTRQQMQAYRGDRISMIFQNPLTSLDPCFTIGAQFIETIQVHRPAAKRAALEHAAEALKLVGIPEPGRVLQSYQHSLSGGMRQRVVVAMALLGEPSLLIADEPTTHLDATVQAQILALLKKIRDDLGTSILIITHDFGVVARLCDRVAVMYAGRIVESGEVKTVLDNPQHPYTQGLMYSVPKLGVRARRLFQIEGSPPDPLQLPAGCSFAPRCPEALPRCRERPPTLQPIGDGRLVSCFVRTGEA